jgi:hypothetical protein
MAGSHSSVARAPRWHDVAFDRGHGKARQRRSARVVVERERRDTAFYMAGTAMLGDERRDVGVSGNLHLVIANPVTQGGNDRD